MGTAHQRDPATGGLSVITRADIVRRVAEWQMTEEVVEKDYVLGWLLWGIGADPVLGNRWVFKGGTCLKKCYIETHRFSEDLDFTVLPRGPFRPEEIEPLVARTLGRVHQASGIDFSRKQPTLRLRPDALSTEGRVYYVGPRQTYQVARVKLDISANEKVVRPPVLQDIAHPYPDGPLPGRVRCYSFDEVFAEKIRAMGQRGRPRDLYDIINLFRRNDLRLYPKLIHDVLLEKCAAKSLPMPSAADFVDSALLAELEADWQNMLAHQLPALPPLQGFLEELPNLFGWLDGTMTFEPLPAIPRETGEQDWSPPATVYVWGAGVPLETVRFAAANHLLMNLTYDGSRRLIEPYSLRRSSTGRLLLHAERADGGGHRAYGVDKIAGLEVTTIPFRPRRAIEFSSQGPMYAPSQSRSSSVASRRRSSSTRVVRPTLKYIYRCTRCHREFVHTRAEPALRAHADPSGRRCSGRYGSYVGRR
jgi:predicted nucleotidyltransferase component of viral defense system